jgi:hypothetical protein
MFGVVWEIICGIIIMNKGKGRGHVNDETNL